MLEAYTDCSYNDGENDIDLNFASCAPNYLQSQVPCMPCEARWPKMHLVEGVDADVEEIC